MRVCLVTGGAGFIGSHLVRTLLDKGDFVRVLDNFSTGRRENLAGIDGPMEVLEGDLRNRADLAAAVRGVDMVFHQAAFVSVPLSIQDPGRCFRINAEGTARLLEAARLAGVQKIVLASSAAVYGEIESLPVREDQPLTPLSPYAASKQVNEIYADLYTRIFNLPVVTLRYFNVYGPRQSPDSSYAAAIPIFVSRMILGQAPTIFGDGHQGRDFIYVGDVVRANLLAAENNNAAGGVYNVCTGTEVDLLNLISTLGEITDVSIEPRFAPPRPGDIYRSYGDPDRSAKVLGFRAQTPLAEGLRRTVEWMRS
jgi:UDP-glucose 4-epimerase